MADEDQKYEWVQYEDPEMLLTPEAGFLDKFQGKLAGSLKFGIVLIWNTKALFRAQWMNKKQIIIQEFEK